MGASGRNESPAEQAKESRSISIRYSDRHSICATRPAQLLSRSPMRP